MLRLEYLEEESKEVAADRDAAREEAALVRAEASACRQEAAAARSEAAQARLAAAAARARADAAEQLPPVAHMVRGNEALSSPFECAQEILTIATVHGQRADRNNASERPHMLPDCCIRRVSVVARRHTEHEGR